MTNRLDQWVAKCPGCQAPHHYRTFHSAGGENDHGYWTVNCSICSMPFVIQLENPRESDGRGLEIIECEEDGSYSGPHPIALDVGHHDLVVNKFHLKFNYSAPPLFRCPSSKENLELAARHILIRDENDIEFAIHNAERFLIKNAPTSLTRCLIKMKVPCRCGLDHIATFYNRARFSGDVNGDSDMDLVTRTLLADVTGTALEDRLDGILSKSEVMTCLEKLIIRWQLFGSRIVVLSPFVGHQFMKAAQKRDIWEWLQQILDPSKAMLITRSASIGAWQKGLSDERVDYSILKGYGLLNKVLESTIRKQDFHAKLYAGFGPSRCEVFSGSANLLRGKSVENMSFRSLPNTDFLERYIERLGIRWPDISAKKEHCITVEFKNGRWFAESDFTIVPAGPL